MFLGDRDPQQLVECGDKRDGIKCGLGKQMRKNGFQGKKDELSFWYLKFAVLVLNT